jgi:hypothetical protein
MIIRLFISIFGFLLILSCNNHQPSEENITDSLQTKNTSLTVNHPEKFDAEFLRGLEEDCNVGHIRITDSMMICQTSDTVFFPLFREYNNLKYANKEGVMLLISWINYNSISTQISFKDQNGREQNFSKKASLNNCFFFGNESFSIESDSSGMEIPGMIMGTEFTSSDSSTNVRVIIDDEDWKYCNLRFTSPNGSQRDIILSKTK